MKYRLLFVCFVTITTLLSCSEHKDPISKDGLGLHLPDSLQATLWAETPMIYNPTNIDVDARGRLWVTEAVNYRNFNNDSTRFHHNNAGDRVVVLEDRDEDGKADTAITFVQDSMLRSPVGIAVFDNKVVVSCSPNLFIYTDTNRDDHADVREILLTGFGGFDHDHSLHAVYGGADGNWYFNTGNAGPHHVKDKAGWTLRSGSIYTGGTPYNNENHGNQVSDDGKVWVGGLALRVRPDGTGLKVMGHNFRNSYEVFPDSYGNLWQNDNDDQVVTCRTSWLMEGGNAGYFSSDGTRFWQADQRPGQDMFTAHWHQDDPGVMPAGDRTGAGAPTGVLRIETDELGAGYRGMLLSADAGRNVIFGYTPSRNKSGYDLGRRLNLVTSLSGDNESYVWNDSAGNSRKESWFRPSDVAVGTDGSLYVADWYDPVVGGHQVEDTLAYGRIYRITPTNKALKRPRYDLATIDGQLEAFKSPAVNLRFVAADLLSQNPAAVKKLTPLLTNNNPFLVARTIFLLARCGSAGVNEVEKLLNHRDEEVRATAFRALKQDHDRMLKATELLVKDTSAYVRRELAIALRDESFDLQKVFLRPLILAYPGNDRWYLESLGAAMDSHSDYWYSLLVDSVMKGQAPVRWSASVADLSWRLHAPSAIADFVVRARDQSLSATERSRAITALAFVKDRLAANAMLDLSKSTDTFIGNRAKYWLGFRVHNDWQAFIKPGVLDADVYHTAKLAAMKVDWQAVIDKRQSADEKRYRLQHMLSDSVGGQMLLDLLARNEVPAEWKPVIGKKIFENPDPGVRILAANYFAVPQQASMIDASKVLSASGDPALGKSLFATNCGSCHKAGESRGNIGPELTGISRKLAPPELLHAILEPDAAIVFGYEPLLVKDKKGNSEFGFLVSDNQNGIELKRLSGQQVFIALADIASREKQAHSVMPSAASMKLNAKDLADILSYLKALH